MKPADQNQHWFQLSDKIHTIYEPQDKCAQLKNDFSSLSTKTYVVGTQNNLLN